MQGELERERSELARRAAYAEAQLAEMQQYLGTLHYCLIASAISHDCALLSPGTSIGKYQKEILRLRQSLEHGLAK